MSFIYREIHVLGADNTWAVGFYNPHGDWQTESTHSTAEKAAERVHWLNGGENRHDRLNNNRIMENLTHAIRNMPTTMRMRPF